MPNRLRLPDHQWDVGRSKEKAPHGLHPNFTASENFNQADRGALFLASADSSYVTGIGRFVDGSPAQI